MCACRPHGGRSGLGSLYRRTDPASAAGPHRLPGHPAQIPPAPPPLGLGRAWAGHPGQDTGETPGGPLGREDGEAGWGMHGGGQGRGAGVCRWPQTPSFTRSRAAGNPPAGSASPARSSRGPAGDGPAAGHTVRSSCCIPKVFPAVIWAIARPPPWAPASILNRPTHPPQLEEAESLPNIPFSLYLRQNPGFVLGGCITSG